MSTCLKTPYRYLVENAQNLYHSCRESVIKNIDKETKDQVMPLLDAILQAQPTIKIKSYQHTSITVTMPKSRYDSMGRPQVGQIMDVDIRRTSA